jgi:DNA-binding XRE family transcriptional regulator
MNPIRKTHRKLTPQRIAALSRLAKKIDRKESAAIKAKGQAVFARHDLLIRLIASLRAARQAQGLSLAEVGEKSGIGKANLSRLENDASPNPTWETIVRYAASVGRKLEVSVR